MSKPTHTVVAIVLRDAKRAGKFLAVKRPTTDPELGSVWGLPAATMRKGELPEETARRVCREKLNCNAVPLRFVGIMFQERAGYDIHLMDIEMLVTQDSKPSVHDATTTGTIYIAQKWTDNKRILMPAAQKGSCCSTIFLTEEGLLQPDDWVRSLVKV